ncbi:hypothetical protein WA026_012186 [Henosepilachna vigintioctopunctata]|uniref:DNA mismatch repair proteins mutS family domain-containing protein n=1 Tax=Henosepilachna vigintioctopunctata TaxID=420089 RepID=A0AAW1VF32_9CUCU
MDEFGKGTSGEDGVTLMAGVLNKFLKENENCPHVVVATHFQQIISYLKESPLLEYQKMGLTRDDNSLVLLFKIEPGISESHAFDIAGEAGLDINIIKRAKEICNCLKSNKVIKPLKFIKSRVTPQNITSENLLSFLSNIEIPGEIHE